MVSAKLLAVLALSGVSIALFLWGYWLGASSMIYSSACELRQIAEACVRMDSIQTRAAVLIGAAGLGAALTAFVAFRRK